MIELRGITWNHTRGYLPMVATSQRFSELRSDVVIHWTKRSLKQFGDSPLDQLATEFDLLVIDYPFVGTAVECNLLVPLDGHLPEAFIADQAAHCVGKSHESYQLNTHQWALAIDAAAPVSGWRSDLLEAAHMSVQDTWTELLEVARRGLVAIPGMPIDTLGHFFMLCIGLGEKPFSQPGAPVSADVAAKALEMLRAFARLVSPQCAGRNPIDTSELLANGHSVAICPFAYGYSNYSRDGYAGHSIEVGDLIRIDGQERCRSMLGGAGLAISSRCGELGTAIEYCHFTASANCQARLYFQSGGQPGHRSAWVDGRVNEASHNFFRNTLRTLDDAWLRPRWHGYPAFQDSAAKIVHDFVWGGGGVKPVLSGLTQTAERCARVFIHRRDAN